MSKAFPTDKDQLLNELDDRYELELSEEEYERLRRLTLSDLFFIELLMMRAMKTVKTRIGGAR